MPDAYPFTAESLTMVEHAVDAPQVQSKYTRKEIENLLAEHDIKFLLLSFTDILGTNKNVEVPHTQFGKALDGQVLFDGSSIQGFVRIEESDMLLQPDNDTFRIFPWQDKVGGRVARLICDIAHPDGTPMSPQPNKAKWTPGTMHIHDLNATILHLVGIDHRRLTYRYLGRDFRLTDVHGHVLRDLIA